VEVARSTRTLEISVSVGAVKVTAIWLADEEDVEVLSTSVKSEGLTFDYQMAGEEGKTFPASVDIMITFIAEDYPDGILSLKKHVLIPTMMFKFSSGKEDS
jgi:hypothetical protein